MSEHSGGYRDAYKDKDRDRLVEELRHAEDRMGEYRSEIADLKDSAEWRRVFKVTGFIFSLAWVIFGTWKTMLILWGKF